jgi:hypothetical protein
MALALVKLKKYRNNKVYEFLDYISAEAAQLGVFVQGSEHNEDEYSKAEIVKIFEEKK